MVRLLSTASSAAAGVRLRPRGLRGGGGIDSPSVGSGGGIDSTSVGGGGGLGLGGGTEGASVGTFDFCDPCGVAGITLTVG